MFIMFIINMLCWGVCDLVIVEEVWELVIMLDFLKL